MLRIRGIPVRLHATFVLLVGGLVLFTFARDGARAAIDTAEFLAILFGSVLVHELGHAWIARRHGIATRSITLHVFGGAAQIDARRVPPPVDLRMSIAGPAVNLVIATVTLPLAWALQSPLFATIAGINVVLGVLNLVPALPMDGGRVLRALLVPSQGVGRANRISLGIGFVFALGFAGLGVATAQAGLVLLAVFMAVLQWREHRVQEILRQHPEWA